MSASSEGMKRDAHRLLLSVIHHALVWLAKCRRPCGLQLRDLDKECGSDVYAPQWLISETNNERSIMRAFVWQGMLLA